MPLRYVFEAPLSPPQYPLIGKQAPRAWVILLSRLKVFGTTARVNTDNDHALVRPGLHFSAQTAQ
jgi:hypothetical protein